MNPFYRAQEPVSLLRTAGVPHLVLGPDGQGELGVVASADDLLAMGVAPESLADVQYFLSVS